VRGVNRWAALSLLVLALALVVADVAEYGTVIGTAEIVSSPRGESYPPSLSEITLWKTDGLEDFSVPGLASFLAFPPGYGSENMVVGERFGDTYKLANELKIPFLGYIPYDERVTYVSEKLVPEELIKTKFAESLKKALKKANILNDY